MRPRPAPSTRSCCIPPAPPAPWRPTCPAPPHPAAWPSAFPTRPPRPCAPLISRKSTSPQRPMNRRCYRLLASPPHPYKEPSSLARARSADDAGAALAQLVEHLIRNEGVRCSSHLSGTTLHSPLCNRLHALRRPFGRHAARARMGLVGTRSLGAKLRISRLPR